MKGLKSKFVKPTFCWEHAKKVGIRNLIDMNDDEYTEYCQQLRRDRVTTPFYYLALIPATIAIGVTMAIYAGKFMDWTGFQGTVRTLVDATLFVGWIGVMAGIGIGTNRWMTDSMYGRYRMEAWFDRYWTQQQQAYQVEHLEAEEIKAAPAPGRKKGLLGQIGELYNRADALQTKRDFSGAAELRDKAEALSKESRRLDAEERRKRKEQQQGKLL